MPAFPCPVKAITLVLALSGFCIPLSETVILVPAAQVKPGFCVFCAPAGVVPTTVPNAEAGISPIGNVSWAVFTVHARGIDVAGGELRGQTVTVEAVASLKRHDANHPGVNAPDETGPVTTSSILPPYQST